MPSPTLDPAQSFIARRSNIPVNATFHKLNERVAVADLEPLAMIYAELLERLLADAPPPNSK